MFALDNENTAIGRIESNVQRGADYASAKGIDLIDFLKIDVEGAEGKVLEGFEPMSRNGRSG